MKYNSINEAIKTKSVIVHEVIDNNYLKSLIDKGWVRSHYVTKSHSPRIYAIAEYADGKFSEPVRTPYTTEILDF